MKNRIIYIFAASALLIALIIFFPFRGSGDGRNNETNKNSETVSKPADSLKKMEIQNPEIKYSDVNANAFSLHYDAVVVDGHNDFLYQVYKRGADLNSRDRFTQTGLPRLLEGGIDVQVFAVWIPSSELRRANTFAKEQISRLKDFEYKYCDRFAIAYNYGDILKAVEDKKLCGLIGIEDGTAVGNEISNLDEFYKLGVRYIGLTWNNNNQIGSSAKDESRGKGSKGLTEFGFETVKRMDELGIMIDVSHLGEISFLDVIKSSKNPVIASHSNCYSLNAHYRNLTDEQIKAIAEKDGVIMVNFLDDFINPDGKAYRTKDVYDLYKNEIDELYNEYGNDPVKFNEERYKLISEKQYKAGTSVDDLVNHIDYIKNLVGADHIGFGSDYDGGITPPAELYDGTCYPIITKKLAERGYTETEIRKILGLNFLRVFKKVCG